MTLPTVSLLGIYLSREKHNLKGYIHPSVLCSTVYKTKIGKQSKCPLTEEWIKKMCYIYTMDYYSAIKKDEIMPFAVTWMDLKSVILSEVSQKEKDKYHMIPLIRGA